MAFPRPVTDLLAIALLCALVAVFNTPLTAPNAILTDHDLYNYFYPYWQYRSDMLREGQLPLWNPYLFTGVPLLANSQVGVLYPPNLLLLGLDAPRAVAAAYLQHLCLAAAGMYLLLRLSSKLGALGGLGGALIFSLGGFFAAQAGHINQVQAAAWAPWVVLGFQQAIEHRQMLWLALAGVCLGVQLTAGHPQESYLTLAITGLMATSETLRTAIRETGHQTRRLGSRLLYPLRFGARLVGSALLGGWVLGGVLVTGAGLAAVQLLPAFELQRESIRAAGLTYREAVSFSFPPWDLFKALLPLPTDLPFGEHYVYVGAAAVAVALLGPHWWRPARHTYLFAGMVVLGLLLALGAYNPAFPWLYQWFPGLNLFRVPARWLFLVVFGLAGLAGTGLDTLVRNGLAPLSRVRLAASLLALTGAGAVVAAVALPLHGLFHWPQPDTIQAWALAGAAAAFGVTLAPYFLRGSLVAMALIALMAWELAAGRVDLPVSHPTAAQAYNDLRPALLRVRQEREPYRVLSIAATAYLPGDWAGLSAQLAAVLPSQAVEDYGVALKNNEVLVPNQGLRFRVPSLDGYDGGLLPLLGWGELKNLLLDSGGARPFVDRAPAALIRDHITGIPDAGFLGKLNVKYIIMDRLSDAWVDGAYHDLGAPVGLRGGQRMVLRASDWGPVTALSLATFLDNAGHVPQGTPAARVTVTTGDSRAEPLSWVLRVGVDTADSEAHVIAAVRHLAARPVAARRDFPSGRVYATRLDLGGVLQPTAIQIESLLNQETITIAGLSLEDGRTGSSLSPPADGRLRRIQTGDLKVYENLAAQPRAFLATAVLRRTEEAALNALPGLAAGGAVIAPDAVPPGTLGDPTAPPVDLVEYRPERVVVRARPTQPTLLVLSDSYFPGWKARVDGVPTPIIRANHQFRAVPLEPGSHTVEFSFEPDSLRLGGVITAGTALGLVAAVAGGGVAWSALFAFRRRLGVQRFLGRARRAAAGFPSRPTAPPPPEQGAAGNNSP